MNDLFHDSIEDKIQIVQCLYDEGIIAVKQAEEESESEVEVEAPNKDQAEEMNLEHPPKKKKSLAQAE